MSSQFNNVAKRQQILCANQPKNVHFCAELSTCRGMKIICRIGTELYAANSHGCYIGLINVILTPKSNRLPILYQLYQKIFILKCPVIMATVMLFLLSIKKHLLSYTFIRQNNFKLSWILSQFIQDKERRCKSIPYVHIVDSRIFITRIRYRHGDVSRLMNRFGTA